MKPIRRPSPQSRSTRVPGRRALALWAALAAGSVAAGAQVPAQAVLQADPAGVQAIKATASLTVLALPVDAHRPAAEGALLGDLDLARLEQEVEQARERLERARREKRDISVRGGVRRPGSTGSSRDSNPAGAWQEMALESAESDAMRDMVDAQTRLTEAPVRAPRNGYVVEYLYPVGSQARKRKPFLSFVPIESTRLTLTLASDAAAPFAAGGRVAVQDSSDPELRFVARIASSSPAGNRTVLQLVPEELPFLTLDTTTAVVVSPSR